MSKVQYADAAPKLW